MPKVLVHEYLSGGGALDGVAPAEAAALLAQGRAMRDAMLADLRALPDVETLVADRAHELPRLVALADAVWSVAPETGGVLEVICASVPCSKWLGCDVASIRVAASKSATRARLAAAGVPVPEAGMAGTRRCIVKPDDGAGASQTRVFESFEQACAAAGAGMTIESFVAGEPLSLSLLCAGGRAELLSINRQRIDIDACGRVAFRGVDSAIAPLDGVRGRALQTLATRVADALPGLFGFVGVDIVEHPRRGPVVIEVNPRLTTAYVGLSARLGRNLARDLLARWRDG